MTEPTDSAVPADVAQMVERAAKSICERSHPRSVLDRLRPCALCSWSAGDIGLADILAAGEAMKKDLLDEGYSPRIESLEAWDAATAHLRGPT